MALGVTKTLVVSQFEDGSFDMFGSPSEEGVQATWQYLTGPELLTVLSRVCGIYTVTNEALDLIAQERIRQVHEEGYTASHDDMHNGGELAHAAAAYASPQQLYVYGEGSSKVFHPIEPHDWRLTLIDRIDGDGLNRALVREMDAHHTQGRIRELTKAGALIAAEIDRLWRLP